MADQARARVPRLAEAAVERARLTVVPRRSAPQRRAPFVVLVSVLLVAGVAGLLLFNTSLQQASFTATSLERTATALQARVQSLQMALERRRDPQQVAAAAKRLGMVPAGSPAFLRLADGKVLGRPAVSDPAAAMRIWPQGASKPRSLRSRNEVVRAGASTASAPAAGQTARRRPESTNAAAGSAG